MSGWVGGCLRVTTTSWHCSVQHGSVQFSPLTGWVVGTTWRTIQQRSSSSLFSGRPLWVVLTWVRMSTLWNCPSNISSADHAVTHLPRVTRCQRLTNETKSMQYSGACGSSIRMAFPNRCDGNDEHSCPACELTRCPRPVNWMRHLPDELAQRGGSSYQTRTRKRTRRLPGKLGHRKTMNKLQLVKPVRLTSVIKSCTKGNRIDTVLGKLL